MVLTFGIILVVAAIALAGVAVLIPRTPTVPLDRRRPFRTEPDSQLTRFAGIRRPGHRALPCQAELPLLQPGNPGKCRAAPEPGRFPAPGASSAPSSAP